MTERPTTPPTHAEGMLKVILRPLQQTQPTRQVVRVILWVVLLSVAMIAHYLDITNFMAFPLGDTPSARFTRLMQQPLQWLQWYGAVAVWVGAMGAFTTDRLGHQWDILRTTPYGMNHLIRSRWVATLFAVRGIISAILLIRLAMVGLYLYDVAGFSGDYLRWQFSNAIPPLPYSTAFGQARFLTLEVWAWFLSSLTLLGAFLMPLGVMGWVASVGLMLGVVIRRRLYRLLVMIFGGLAYLALALILEYIVATKLVYATYFLNNWLGWLQVASLALFGDWGTRFLWLGFNGDLWAQVPYSVYLPPLLGGVSMLLLALTEPILKLATWMANRWD